MIEAARHDKNGVLQSVSRSNGRSLSDVMSALGFLHRLKTAMLQSVGEVCLA